MTWRLSFRAMNCAMSAHVASASPRALLALFCARADIATLERRLSRFRPDSELSQLNQRSGRWVVTSRPLWFVIQAALASARTTDGLVTPAILSALETAGYDRSFERVGPGDASAIISSDAVSVPDWRDIELDPARRAVRLPTGMRLDLGGVAKGWAARRAVRRLRVHGPALVDAGGDIAAAGMSSQDGVQPWLIGIAHSLQPDQRLPAPIVLRNGGVATSGRDIRTWLRHGARQHHIIDPRSGRPADTDIVSVTVIARDVIAAETAAKAVLIQGSGAGLRWLNAQPGVAGMALLADGAVLTSDGFSAYLHAPAEQENTR